MIPEVIILVIWSLVAVAIVVGIWAMITLTLNYVNGDDSEDPGRLTLKDQLLKRFQEWQIQKAINETLATAERFK